MLSDPAARDDGTVASQMTVLDVLRKIVTERSIVFGAGNHELEFFACLTYCLLQLNANKRIEVGSPTAVDQACLVTFEFGGLIYSKVVDGCRLFLAVIKRLGILKGAKRTLRADLRSMSIDPGRP